MILDNGERPDPSTVPSLGELRTGIDDIDRQIMELYGKRFELTTYVGHRKAIDSITAVDPLREEQQFQRATELAEQYNVPVDLAQSVLRLVIDAVVEEHKRIRTLYEGE